MINLGPNIGHGCFFIANGGCTLSHSNKENNNVLTGFQFDRDDVIRVETNEKELLFTNETKKWEHKMKIELTEEEWKEACFCVNLYEAEDSVSILE